MRYLSICSGIEAATVAWKPLGWEAAAFAEIEPFPSAVLAHHYPDVPNVGDFTQIKGDEFGTVDLLVAGTPCQAFSVAGRREGLDDERGNLTLEFIRLADRLRPPWLVWENVPGVLSLDEGRTFGTILGELAKLGYGFAYRIFDAQYFGVPQRRRRVFVVGHFGDWRRAAAVLFERHSLQGHTPPGRGQGKEVTGSLTSRFGRNGGTANDDINCKRLIPSLTAGPPFSRTGNSRVETEALIACAVTAKWAKGTGGGAGDECQNLLVANTLRGEGFDGSEDGTGRQTLIPIDMRQATREVKVRECNQPGAGIGNDGDPAFTLSAGGLVQAACVMQGRWRGDDGRGYDRPPHVADLPSLDAQKVDMVASIAIRGREGGCNIETRSDGTANALRTPNGGRGGEGCGAVLHHSAVRRLTPRECERLQGFPDDFTLFPYRKKPAADSPRYKALGNSMAVPVMRWIGERIERIGRAEV